MELFPAIDILGGHVVRLKQGDYNRATVYEDDPVRQARIFEEEGARWVHMVDLDGALSGKPEILDIVRRVAEETSLRVEVGGGIRSMESLSAYDDCGVSRMVLGTALVRDPGFAEQAGAAFPGKIVAGIDARDGEVAISGWTEGSGIMLDELVVSLGSYGIRDIVYTDISRDGMQTGIDADAYARLARTSGARVTASGGISSLDDLRLLEDAGGVWGVIVGRALYEGSFTVAGALSVVGGGSC